MIPLGREQIKKKKIKNVTYKKKNAFRRTGTNFNFTEMLLQNVWIQVS